MSSARTVPPRKIFYAILDMDGSVYNAKYMYYLHMVVLHLYDNKIDLSTMKEDERDILLKELKERVITEGFKVDRWRENANRVDVISKERDDIEFYGVPADDQYKLGMFVYRYVLMLYRHGLRVYTEILYRSNLALLDSVKDEMQSMSLKEFHLVSGTNRLTRHHDLMSIATNGTGQAYQDFIILSGLFKMHLAQDDVTVTLRRLTTPDIFSNKSSGTNFEKCLPYYDDVSASTDEIYFYDDSKYTVIAGAIGDLLRECTESGSPAPFIYAHFYDDVDAIHAALDKLFRSCSDNDKLLPTCVRLHCHPYRNGGFHYVGDYVRWVDGKGEYHSVDTLAVRMMGEKAELGEHRRFDFSEPKNLNNFLRWRKTRTSEKKSYPVTLFPDPPKLLDVLHVQAASRESDDTKKDDTKKCVLM